MNIFLGGKSPFLRVVLGFRRSLIAESGVGEQVDKLLCLGRWPMWPQGRGLAFMCGRRQFPGVPVGFQP